MGEKPFYTIIPNLPLSGINQFQEIAAKAGTSESQIVKYFGSKAGILDALFSKARTYIDEPFEKICKELVSPVLLHTGFSKPYCRHF